MPDHDDRPEVLWTAGERLAWHRDALDLPWIDCRPGPWPSPPRSPRPRASADPWTILGNPGLTLFAHAGGSYQLLHTERGFARLNHDGGAAAVGAACRARIEIDGVAQDLLVGTADFAFGCGWARWRLRCGALHIERRLAVAPGARHDDRIPAALLTWRIRNLGDAPIAVAAEEAIGARYHAANWCNPPAGRRLARYPVAARREGGHAAAIFSAEALAPLVFDARDRLAQADGHPAQLRLSVLAGGSLAEAERIDAEGLWLRARAETRLAPGASHDLRLAVGWSEAGLDWTTSLTRIDRPTGDLHAAWDARLPRFPDAPADLAAELRWHAHVLHAMSTWDTRYRCSFVPQGTLYEYGLGVAAVTRDHAMHALPACRLDPDLARSVLAYLARHSDRSGRIQHTDEGAGLVPLGCDQKSDNQLYALCLAAEYFTHTADAAALAEAEPFFPPGGSETGSLLGRIAAWLRYLRDVIHVDAHGLLRIGYSDISDTLHRAFAEQGYPRTFDGGSHVNAGMAVVVCERLADALAALAVDASLLALRDETVAAARAIAADQRAALDRALAGRPWCPRGRVGDDVLGVEDAFAMPQAFVFADTGRDPAQRRAIWEAVRPRVWNEEPFGVRLREGAGRHRCGMVWAAWSGWFASGLLAVDPEAARATLERLRLRTRAEREPEQWVGLWSGSDCTAAYQGAGDWEPGSVRAYCDPFPVFCAHVHAWPLQLWLDWRATTPTSDPDNRTER